MKARRKGVSYRKRVEDINDIFDHWSRLGVPNREIWARYIYPKYGISERTLYNILKAPSEPERIEIDKEVRQLLLFDDIDDDNENLF